MIPPLNVWLPDPLRWNEELSAQIAASGPGVVLHPRTQGTLGELDGVDGRGIHVFVGEQLPTNLAAWPDLQLAQVVAAGVDYLKGHPIWQSGVQVATARGVHSVPIAEHVTALLLMLSHRLNETTRFGDTWVWPDRRTLFGTSLRGKTVGIIGYGAIGSECGRQLNALGMRVLACEREPDRISEIPSFVWPGTGDPQRRIPERVFSPRELAELLPSCHAVVVTAPRTDETLGMIGAAELNLLPTAAWIVVVSRGGIVDEPALAAALHQGKLAGAAVDTYLVEPPPADHPLRGAPNLIATPHMAGNFDGIWSKICLIVCENIRRLANREPLANLVTQA